MAIVQKLLLPICGLFLGILFLLLGMFISQIIKIIISSILNFIKFDWFVSGLKLNLVLERAEIKKVPSEIVAEIGYWLSILILILGLSLWMHLPIEPMLDKILNYSGIVFMAALILTLGTFLAIFIGNIIYLLAANLGFSGAKPISKIIQYATVIFTFILALEQMGIGPALLAPSLGVIIGAVGLGAAIAFGLGCKDIMADFVSNLIRGK